MPKAITPFLLQTRFEVDPKQGRAAFKQIEGDVDHLTTKFEKAGKEVTAAFKGAEAGKKFGSSFGDSASSAIIGALGGGGLGQTLGALIGTAMAPGIGSAIGSSLGSAVDSAIGKVSGPIMATIGRGIELNKMLEQTTVEFTTFAGSEKEAVKYLEDLKRLAIGAGKPFEFVVETSEHIYDLTNNLKLTNTILKAATDQAADFGGKAETITAVANALGLVAEKGDLSGQSLKQLFKLGIDAPKRLAEATGFNEKYIKQLISQNRLRGDVAARLISESIEREKGGYAEKLAASTTQGAQDRFGVLGDIRAAEGTANATKGLGDFYRQANSVLDSPQAKKLVDFIDSTTGSLIGLVEKGLNSGLNLAKGLTEGIAGSESIGMVTGAISKVGTAAIDALEDIWEMKSPSKRFKRSGGDAVEGLAQGIESDQSKERLRQALENLLEDPRIKAMLDTISFSEHAGYNTMVGGGNISDLSRHPNKVVNLGKGLRSSAAGRYQFLSGTYKDEASRIGLTDFTPHSQDLAAVDQLLRSGAAAKLLADNFEGAVESAKKIWASFPGAGYGQGERSMGSLQKVYAHSLAVSGKDVSQSNPMPVDVVSVNGRSGDDWAGWATSTKQKTGDDWAGWANNSTVHLSEADSAVVNINDDVKQLISTSDVLSDAVTLTLRPLQALGMDARLAVANVAGVMAARQGEYAATKEYQEAARQAVVKAVSFTSQIAGMLGQVAGQIPGQQVGKKRSLFSKILGIAAPFLSFIPGVGPILSAVAGIASNAIGGNYAGAVSGLAGGFQTGGVFTSHGGGSSAGASGAFPYDPDFEPHARGGPVRRGGRYWVGEQGPEPFIPASDGWILPHGSTVSSGAGRGRDPEMLAMLQATHELMSNLHSRLQSMKPGEVVSLGAHTIPEAMSKNADLTRKMGQRFNFS